MRKLILSSFLLAFGIVALAAPGGTQAQSCSTADKTTLRNCVDASITDCGAASANCDPTSVALSVQDVKEIAVEKCCGFSKKIRRKACLTKEKIKYSPRISAGAQKPFFSAARTEIDTLKANDCGGNAYSKLF